MKISKKSLVTLALMAAMGVGAVVVRAAVEAEKERSSLMQRKLDSAQGLLEALVLEDFDAIKKNADELVVIALEARWKKLNTPAYNQISSEFQSAAGKVAVMAEAKNLDGATLGFMQLTMTCVECHKVVRDAQGVAAAPQSLGELNLKSKS